MPKKFLILTFNFIKIIINFIKKLKMNSDSTYQTNKKEIININNIYFEDSITDLINVLVKSIGDFYLKSLPLIKTSHQLIIPFESNLSKITSMTSTSQSDLYKIINELI